MPVCSPYHHMTLCQLGKTLRSGEMSCVGLMQQTLDFIEARDASVHAFVALDGERALAEAARADADLQQGRDRGALHGIPFAVKDIIDATGFETGCGAQIPIYETPEDAACVAALKQGGAIMIGKLNSYEFAFVGPDFGSKFAPSRNPWNLEHITGGSSSGSAAAVAGGMLAFALGTDTGGSVRSPASYCGCVGIKPSFGTFPMAGVVPLAPSMDVVGLLSANVADNALIFDILQGGVAQQTLQQDIAGLKIGYARRCFADDAQCAGDVIAALDEVAAQFSLMGAQIEEVILPDYATAEACGVALLRHEALQFHEVRLKHQPEIYHDFIRQYLYKEQEAAQYDDMDHFQKMRLEIRQHIEILLQKHDALLLATTLESAPKMADFADGKPRWTPMRTILFNVTGHPVLAVPAGMADNGLPIGLQLVGKYHDEAMLYRLAYAFERYSGWTDRIPPLIHNNMNTYSN